MDSTLSHWLRLREPADFAARSATLTRGVAEAVPRDTPVSLLDLGTGTGSNIRYLANHLPGAQRWLALDRDATLLAELPERMSSWSAERGYEARTERGRCLVRGRHLDCHIETRQYDLGTLDDYRIFAGRHLVTASALLDLVSESWLLALATHCRAAGAVVLFAITYNGRFTCAPAEDEDDMVRELMNRHQKTDKGLGGPAAGPGAAACAEQFFMGVGYTVLREPSDWTLGPAENDVQRLLIEGWAQAATEMSPERAAIIERWRARRLAHVAADRSGIVVGHDDLAAWPPGTHLPL
jgi:hypothetical protein